MTHFPKFWGKKIFLAYMALSCTTSYGFLAPCQNLEKTNDAIPRKCLDRQKDGRKGGWKDGRKDEWKGRWTLFHRTLPATIRGPKIAVELKESFLIQDKAFLTHINRINLFIVYELDTWWWDLNMDFTLDHCLFRAVELTKNSDPD